MNVLKNLMVGIAGLLRWPLRFISRRRVFIGASLSALVFLSCVSGASIIYFDLGPAYYLRKSFAGLDAWIQHGNQKTSTGINGGTQLGISRDELEKTCDGFTLYTTVEGCAASLIDMRGNVVHHWSRPFSQVWPRCTHVKYPVPDDMVHWFRCRLFPDGHLLAIYQADSDTPHGYGLVKLDKDSNVVWSYAANVHHDLDIGEDGNLYCLTHQISNKRLKEFNSILPPYLEDCVVILSPDGQELEKISIIEAFQNSPYALLLSTINAGTIRSMQTRAQGQTSSVSPLPAAVKPGTPVPLSPKSGPSMPSTMKSSSLKRAPAPPLMKEQGDIVHANSIKVLSRSLAPKFPLFKEGQVLISLCNLNAIAVLDIPSRKIVWASQGIWLGQHDAEFLENGHLLLYDNSGQSQNTRILEFDPTTHGYPWSYSNENSVAFITPHRGMKQHLLNGNVLIVDADGGRLFEVNSAKELVWEYGCPSKDEEPAAHAVVTGALRYSPSQLRFLGDIPVRP